MTIDKLLHENGKLLHESAKSLPSRVPLSPVLSAEHWITLSICLLLCWMGFHHYCLSAVNWKKKAQPKVENFVLLGELLRTIA